MGNQVLSTNVYSNDRNGILKEVQYGNGGKVVYEHDDFDRITGVKYDGESSPRYTYEYGANGQAAFMKDNNLNRIHQTEYDLAERPVQSTIRDTSDNLIYRTTLTYDGKNRLSDFAESLPEESHKTSYTYDKDNRTTKIQYDDASHKVDYTYDALGRVTKREVTNGSKAYASNYAYETGSTSLYGTGATTPLVKTITQGSGNTLNFSYEYDERGNIISETRNSKTTTYAYDALGQLVSVNDPHENAIWEYTYDLGGNITKKQKFARNADGSKGTAATPVTYTYGDSNWKDKLTAYNGTAITYDEIGNPLTDGTWTYVWQAGRQLKQMSKNGMTVEFKYNAAGLRVQKKVTEGTTVTTTDYTLHGKLITHMTVGTNKLHFFYDNASRPAMVKYNGVLYTYVHNLQGDIVGIVDSSGNLVVEYKYDAWGKPLTEHTGLGKLNPFRYRGYVFDEETGIYYLRSRFFNTGVGRFLNADGYIGKKYKLFAHNVYSYCINDPILGVDPSGHSFVSTLAAYAKRVVNKAISALNSLMESVNKTRIIGNKLIRKGKMYSIYNPSEHPKVTIGPIPKCLEKGTSRKTFFSTEQMFTNLGMLDMDSVGLIYPFKDSLVGIDLNVSILQTGDRPAEAHITMTVFRHYTDMELGVNPVSKIATSDPIRVLRSSANGFWVAPIGSEEVFVKDDNGWLNDVIESVEWG